MNGLFRTRIAQLESVPDAERADVDIAAFYARLGEPEAAFAHLELAFVKHSEGLASLKSDVRFDRVREDPRFARLLSRIGVPE
jgi:hypothetical protein